MSGVLLIVAGIVSMYAFTPMTLPGLYYWVVNPKERADVKGCIDNLHHIQVAMGQYLDSYDAYPPAGKWMDLTMGYARQGNMDATESWKYFRCPSVSKGNDASFGYAMNRMLSSKLSPLKEHKAEWELAKKTPAVFDSSDLRKNASGSPALLPRPGRHGGKNNVLYGDGHAAAVK